MIYFIFLSPYFTLCRIKILREKIDGFIQQRRSKPGWQKIDFRSPIEPLQSPEQSETHHEF